MLCETGLAFAKISGPPESRPHAPAVDLGVDAASLRYLSELERAILTNPAGAYRGDRCSELEPLVRTESASRNRFIVAYLGLVCAKNLSDKLRNQAEVDRLAESAAIPSGEYFGQRRIRVDGLLDAFAYVRAKQRQVVAMYLEARGGGRSIDLVVLSKDVRTSPLETWRLDITATAERAIAGLGESKPGDGESVRIARDLPGLVYLTGAASSSDAPSFALVGRALFRASQSGQSLADADVRALLDRAAAQPEDGNVAQWLLAKSWLHGEGALNADALARVAVLARKSAHGNLPDGQALVVAMAELGLGNVDADAGKEALQNLRASVGEARAEYLVWSAMKLLDKRNDAKTASRRWLGRAAGDGDALAQFELGERCAQAEFGQAGGCRVQWYSKAAAQGHVNAMRQLGILYRDGVTVAKDPAKAGTWFEKAVELGSVDALAELGNFYFGGWDRSKDPAKAVQYYKKGAEQGEPWAENNLAVALRLGQGATRNFVESLRWSRLSAFQGNLSGMNGWAYALDEGEGAAPDSHTAFDIYAWCAHLGGVVCMSNLGGLYQAGRGVDKSPERAMYWFGRAADGGNAVAMSKLGWMLFEGGGVPVDQAAGEKWLRKSALNGNSEGMRGLGYALLYREQSPAFKDGMDWLMRSAQAGNALAMNNLAAAYKTGKVVPKDMRLYEQWLQRAGDAGDTDSMNSLGWFYEHDDTGAADPAKAAAWYKRGSDAGNVDAMNNYARQLNAGAGVPRDQVEAKRLYEIAASRGSHHAKCNLGEMLAAAKDTRARGWSLALESADAGNLICQRIVGLAYHYGDDPDAKGDIEKSRHYLQLAAAQGDDEAQADLADVILQTRERDASAASDARKVLETLADKGVPRAQVLLGSECMAGRGGPVDLPCTRRRYEQLASRETEFRAFAASQLGELLVAGKGGPVDRVSAEKWFRVAIAAQSFRGPYDLGTLLLKEGHPEEGLQLLDKAVTNRNLAAAYRIKRYCRENPTCTLGKVRRTEIDSMFDKLSNNMKNNVAWVLATDPSSDAEDGRFAASLAESIGEASLSNAAYLDTLAACQARAGEFKMAQITQKEALNKLDPGGPPSSRRQMEDRRQHYASNQPWNGPG